MWFSEEKHSVSNVSLFTVGMKYESITHSLL